MATVEPALLALIYGKLRLFYELADQRQRAPGRVEVARKREERCRVKMNATEQTLQDMRLKAKQKQTELATREAQVKKMQSQQDGAANNREYAMLGDTIKATVAANEVLGDELLELLEQIDALVITLEQEKQLLRGAEQDTKDTADKTDEAIKVLDREIRELEGELAEQMRKLPSDVCGELERRRPNLKDKTVAPVDDGACGSCWQTITPQMRSALMMKQLINCGACGALLFFPPN